MSYPYIQSQEKLKNFMTEISSRGIPEKINQEYLESIGYASKNDRPIIAILKTIGMIDKENKPNQNYANFRDITQTKQIMATLIGKAYSELFVAYPNAPHEDRKKLDNWFKTKLGVGDVAASHASGTFLTLSLFADFNEEAKEVKEQKKEAVKGEPEKKEMKPTYSEGVIVNLNIQLVLPATENVEVYDKIFKSLKENILKE
jgi:hypothetical protein